MNKKVWLFLTTVTITAGALAVACGDDDNAGGGTTVDAGNDGSTLPGADGGGNDAGDGGNGQCTFAGFVTGLINTSTTASALPSTDLGDSCTPSTSQADFTSLF